MLVSGWRMMLIGLAAAVAWHAGASAGTYKLNVNTALAPTDPLYQGLVRFAAGVQERTGHDLEVQIFPFSALGSDDEVLDQARAGINVAVVSDGGRLSKDVPEFGILSAPYLVDDFGQLRKLVTSDLFWQWADKLAETSGHEILAFNWYQGDRHLLTRKAISVPADFEGLRVRTLGAPVWYETMRGIGGTPVALPWSEVHEALQRQAIDAAEAQMPAIYGERLYEVINHITKTGHIALITGLVTSHQWFEQLPASYQSILKEEALAGGDIASQATINSIAGYESLMRQAGVTISDVDKAPFKAATAHVYDVLGLRELRAEVDRVLNHEEPGRPAI